MKIILLSSIVLMILIMPVRNGAQVVNNVNVNWTNITRIAKTSVTLQVFLFLFNFYFYSIFIFIK